jgi:transcription antitermination factor NusG
MLKLAENPPVLPGEYTSLTQIRGRWWVAHTKARFEKVFAWDLLQRNIGYFLPLLERVTISGGKKRRVLRPLFPSYVFFCGDEEDRYAAMRTNRLCQAIDVADQSQLVRELAAIEKALMGKASLDPYPFMVAGRSCRVIGGVFKGLEGIVVERSDVTRVLLQVSILGQGAMMEIDADLIEPVD